MNDFSSTYQDECMNTALTCSSTPTKHNTTTTTTSEIKEFGMVHPGADPWTVFESRQEASPSTPEPMGHSSGRDDICEINPTSLFNESACFDDCSATSGGTTTRSKKKEPSKSFDELIESELDDIIDHVVRWNRRRR